jgi:AcrR family transcriptional regulator
MPRERPANSKEFEDLRREILSAAATAFMEMGFSGTSIDEVTDRLGATKGLIYYYYKSKADLFFDIHREAIQMNLTAIRPVFDTPESAKTRLRKMLITQALLIMQNLPFMRTSMQGLEMHLAGETTPKQREFVEKVTNIRDEVESLFVKVIEDGIKAGDFRDVDARFTAKPLLGAVNWMTVWYRPRPKENKEAQRRIAEQTADLLINCLVPCKRKA